MGIPILDFDIPHLQLDKYIVGMEEELRRIKWMKIQNKQAPHIYEL
jgi:hypothetical protein